jgi:hypothetical protein
VEFAYYGDHVEKVHGSFGSIGRPLMVQASVVMAMADENAQLESDLEKEKDINYDLQCRLDDAGID